MNYKKVFTDCNQSVPKHAPPAILDGQDRGTVHILMVFHLIQEDKEVSGHKQIEVPSLRARIGVRDAIRGFSKPMKLKRPLLAEQPFFIEEGMRQFSTWMVSAVYQPVG